MPARVPRKRSYHHGDLRSALLTATHALVEERGPRAFSLTEAARRAGVSAAAPYRHFVDKDALLAAVAVDGYERLTAALTSALDAAPAAVPARLSALARAYVTFATEHGSHFRVMFGAGLDKSRHAGLVTAADRAFDLLVDVVHAGQSAGALPGRDPRPPALAIWSIAHGVAVLLIEGALDHVAGAPPAPELAARTVAGYVAGLTRLSP